MRLDMDRDSLFADLRESLRNYEFWLFSAWLEIVSRYRRSYVGVFWVFLPPIATFCVLGYFYSGIIGRSPLVFMPYMGMGFALWRFVTQVMNEASSVFLQSRAFIMDGRIRLTDYILKSISKAAFFLAAALLVLVALLLISPEFTVRGLPLATVGFVIFFWNMVCAATVLALVGARHPDFHEITTSIFIFGFLLTPILWYPESLAQGGLRAAFVQINPVFHFIEAVRAPLLGRTVGWLTPVYLACFTAANSLLATLVYRRYSRFVPIWI